MISIFIQSCLSSGLHDHGFHLFIIDAEEYSRALESSE